jgi:hypothetical protein
MTTIVDTLREYWVRRGLTPAPGVDAAELAAFEARYRLELPADVRAYFLAINGVAGGRDGAWDADMIAFWPLADVQPLSDLVPESPVPSAARYVVFADWSIDAYFYAVRLPARPDESAPVCIVADTHVEPVAASFREFFTRYIAGDDVVRYGKPLAPPQH